MAQKKPFVFNLQTVTKLFLLKSTASTTYQPKGNYITLGQLNNKLANGPTFNNGLNTNKINPAVSDVSTDVSMYVDCSYNKLCIGNTTGTIMNGPITLGEHLFPNNFNQLGYSITNTTIYTKTSSVGSNTPIILTSPSTAYPVSIFSPGNYLLNINGYVDMSGSNSSPITISVKGINTSTATVGSTYNTIKAPLWIYSTTINTNKGMNVSCSGVLTITPEEYALISGYISTAIVVNSSSNTSYDDYVSLAITSHSITRIG